MCPRSAHQSGPGCRRCSARARILSGPSQRFSAARMRICTKPHPPPPCDLAGPRSNLVSVMHPWVCSVGFLHYHLSVMTAPLDQVNSASSSLPNVSGTPPSCREAGRSLASTTGTVLSCSRLHQREANKPAVQLAQHTENSTSSWSNSWYQRRVQSRSGTSTSRSSRSPSLSAACTVQELLHCRYLGRTFNLQAQSFAMSPQFAQVGQYIMDICMQEAKQDMHVAHESPVQPRRRRDTPVFM